MKKRILIVMLFVWAGVLVVNAQRLKHVYPAEAGGKVTPLPFACGKCTPYDNPVLFEWGKGKGLPLFSYRDLNGTKQNTNEENDTYIFRHFELDGGVDVLAIAVERSMFVRHLLLVYKNGKLTDHLEAGISSNVDIAMKQWKIDADGLVQIFSFKVEGDRSILFNEDFDFVRLRREDVTYQIDGQGKFKKLDKVKYDSQEYTREELMDKDKNIWNY